MPSNCCGEECHKDLRPEVLINDGKDAVADSNPDERYGIDFDLEWYGAVLLEVTYILSKSGMIYQPVVESIRRFKPQRCGK